MLCRRTGRQNTRRRQKSPLRGDRAADGQRVMPPAENAGPFWGMRAQVLDWFRVHRENALRSDAHYAAETAAITNYDGAGAAAELRGSDK